jgi:hypothetical protein
LECRRLHSSPGCSLGLRHSNCVSPRIRARIPATTFRTLRGSVPGWLSEASVAEITTRLSGADLVARSALWRPFWGETRQKLPPLGKGCRGLLARRARMPVTGGTQSTIADASQLPCLSDWPQLREWR